MKDSLQGKTALITGASSGIGKQVALDLAAQGVRVFLVARRREHLLSVKHEIEKQGGLADYFVCDLEDHQARAALLHTIFSRKIAVDILVNNAGFGWYGYFADMPADVRKRLVQVNIDAMLDLTAALLPEMRQRGFGHIINIGSIVGGFPNQGIAMYSASKAFMDAFSTSLFREMKGSGVCISVLRLGPVQTGFYDYARNLPNGRSVPAESFAISVEKASRGVLRLLHNRHRYLYVPAFLGVTRVVGLLFGGVIDLFGPILLKRKPH